MAPLTNADEEFVREVLRRRLLPLADVLSRERTSVNPFLDAIGADVAASSSLTRALTSRMGRWLAAVARDLAVKRYGEEAVPPVLYSDTVTSESEGASPLGNDTVVVTQLDRDATLSASVTLLRGAVATGELDARIGTDEFRAKFREKVAELRRLPKAERPWSVQVDLFVNHPSIGLAELESGGNLDTSNVKTQPEKLVRAGLAYGEQEVPLHFALAYANRGEGIRPQGGLPKYLAPAGSVEPSSGLLVGSAWWRRVLPVGVSHERFLQLFGEVVRELQEKARPAT